MKDKQTKPKKKIEKIRKEWHEAIEKADASGGFEYAYWSKIAEQKLKELKKYD